MQDAYLTRRFAWRGPSAGKQPEGGVSMQAAASNAEGIRILVLLGAIAIVAFWRTAIRLVLILVVTAIIVAIGYGAVALYQNLHHVTG